tara:strand:- start:117 stop:536 length:420 start_codon:yes stop_codon:yes gene_type:complete
MLSRWDDPIVNTIDERICETLAVNEKYGEAIQGQYYEEGQYFKPHTDFFAPGTKEYDIHCKHYGNRTWTFMIYVKAPLEGGCTLFHDLGIRFNPVIGSAVIWKNLHEDGTPNEQTIHEGEPLIKGSKIVITKWFREKCM